MRMPDVSTLLPGFSLAYGALLVPCCCVNMRSVAAQSVLYGKPVGVCSPEGQPCLLTASGGGRMWTALPPVNLWGRRFQRIRHRRPGAPVPCYRRNTRWQHLRRYKSEGYTKAVLGWKAICL
jgi:hypothetical protein